MNLKHLGFGDFLEEDEKVFAVFRHPLGGTFVKMLFFAGIWGAISYAVWFYWDNYYYDYSAENKYNYLWLIPAIIGAIKVFDVFMRWYANAILMTNESLVFVNFRHIFDKSASRIDYFDLDDVELEKKGVGDYLGNKGDLIFTKVSGGSKEFKRVWNPRKIIRKIREHKAKMLAEKNFTEESALKDLLSQLVQTHVRRKGQPDPEREKFRGKNEEICDNEENLSDEDLICLKVDELEDDIEKDEKEIVEENENPTRPELVEWTKNSQLKGFSIHHLKNLAKKITPHHFRNEINTTENIDYEERIEIEKELDDEGGLEIDL